MLKLLVTIVTLKMLKSQDNLPDRAYEKINLSAPYNYTDTEALIARFNYTGEDLYELSLSKYKIAGAFKAEIEQEQRMALRPNATDLLEADEFTQQAFSSNFKVGNCLRRGMTWRAISAFANYTVGEVGCGDCDPINGDTQCWTKRPLLCLYKANMPRLNMTVTEEDRYYHGWSGAYMAPTKPVRGCYIQSKWHGDWICSQELGVGWQMADFSDGRYEEVVQEEKAAEGGEKENVVGVVPFEQLTGQGGFNFYGLGDKEGKLNYSRFWTSIGKTQANCWDK